jgi:hypothetical protein
MAGAVLDRADLAQRQLRADGDGGIAYKGFLAPNKATPCTRGWRSGMVEDTIDLEDNSVGAGMAAYSSTDYDI